MIGSTNEPSEVDVVLWDESGTGVDATCLGETCLNVWDLLQYKSISDERSFDLFQYVSSEEATVVSSWLHGNAC
jgi:hypothetical protein